MLVDRVDRDPALQRLEAIGRSKGGARSFVDAAVVGAADPCVGLEGALGRADIDGEVDIAPVDAEVEQGSADHAARSSVGHGVLDLAALHRIERALMQRDREAMSSFAARRS